jgi:alanine-synthesizing transaminase
VRGGTQSVQSRYSASRGITKLRHAISDWYHRRFGVELDPDTEAITTIGAKEGLAHLALAIVEPGDIALVPNPTYPIHAYSVVIAGGDVRHVRLDPGEDFFANLMAAFRESWPQPKLLILSFPHNPTTAVVDLEFFRQIAAFAQDHDL